LLARPHAARSCQPQPPVLFSVSDNSSSSFSASLPNAQLFPPISPLPPARPNTAPRCNVVVQQGLLPHVITPLIHDAWAHFLKDYPNREFVSSLLHIIKFGANIGFRGVQAAPRASKNLKSALQSPDFIQSSIDTLLAGNHAHGPFPSPPLNNFRCSPLGVVFRKRSILKPRLINHLSWPPGSSVNDGILDSEASISYDAFDCAVKDLVSAGVGSLMAKLDLKDAFRHIPIRPADWHHMGFCWADKFYYSIVLAFGLRSAPYIFNLFSEALHWIIQHHIPAHIRHYLDDFLMLFTPSSQPSMCSAAVEWVMGLGRELGLVFQDSKTVWPTTQIEFLGLELDSVAMEARLPPDKLVFLKTLLQHWSVKRFAGLKEVQELAGFLQFVSQVIPCSRSFLRRIIDFSMKFRSPFQKLHVAKGVRADICWWQTFCTPWNGIHLLRPSIPSVIVHTDASGRKGIGGVCNARWFSSRVPRRYRGRDIQFKEVFAILHAILRWGDTWANHHLTLYCDNEAVVSWLTSGTCRSSHSMPIVRMISMMAACLQFSYSCVWIPTKENSLADAASRFQFTRLFQLAPHLCRTSSATKSQLTGLRRTLSSLDVPRSISGTDWHPALEKPTHLASVPTSTSSESALPSSMLLASTSQPQAEGYWNGSHHLAIEPSCPRRLSHTSQVFVPCMSMPACLSSVVSPPPFNASSEASSVSMGRKSGHPNYLSRSISSGSSPQCPGISASGTILILTQPSRLHGQDSYGAGNLRFPIDTVLTPQSISLAPQSRSSQVLASLRTFASPCPPQRQTHFGRAFRSS
jgi:hypothetical protein